MPHALTNGMALTAHDAHVAEKKVKNMEEKKGKVGNLVGLLYARRKMDQKMKRRVEKGGKGEVWHQAKIRGGKMSMKKW